MNAITEKLKTAVREALADDYYEGAVELVFLEQPDPTRDQAVDIVEMIATMPAPNENA